MKILLINPPSEHIITTTQAKYVIKERGTSPPLGLLYLATSIKRNTDHDVKILDCQLHGYGDREIETQLEEFRPDIVGITAITFLMVDSLRVARIAKAYGKKANRQVTVMVGGPHVTIFPEETATLNDIDFALAGEAEFTILQLIANLQDDEALKQVPGICFRKNGNLFSGPRQDYIQNMDAVPIPNRRLLEYDKYANVLTGTSVFTTMMTSRGCPYQCIFCERLGQKFRAASAEYVISEIEDCLSLGIDHIFFHDDTFTIDRERVFRICRYIQEKSLRFSFSLRSRVNTIDEEMIRELKSAGCNRISFGVESGVQRILNRIKKGITLTQAEKAFALTRKYKITSLADFMIGHPDETIPDIEETIRFAKKIRPDYIQFSVTTPYPGTDLYREALTKGIIETDVWKEFAENPTPHFVPPRWEETIDKQAIYQMLHRCYREFYLNPHFIVKNLLGLRGWNELVRKMKAGVKLVYYETLEKFGINKDGFR